MATIGTVQLSALQSRLAHWSGIHRLRGTPPGDRMSLVLEAGLEIEGDVVARGRVTVNGTVRGNIYCHTLDLSGTVHGDVVVKRLIVQLTGSLHGKPRYDDLELHDGGRIVEPTTAAKPQAQPLKTPPLEAAPREATPLKAPPIQRDLADVVLQHDVMPPSPRVGATAPSPAREDRPKTRQGPPTKAAARGRGDDAEEDSGPRFYSSYGF